MYVTICEPGMRTYRKGWRSLNQFQLVSNEPVGLGLRHRTGRCSTNPGQSAAGQWDSGLQTVQGNGEPEDNCICLRCVVLADERKCL